MSPHDQRAVHAFRRHLEAERGFSAHTVRAYVRDVERLAESDEGRSAGRLDAIEPLALRSYLASFHRVHRPSTRNRRLSALRSFFRFRGFCLSSLFSLFLYSLRFRSFLLSLFLRFLGILLEPLWFSAVASYSKKITNWNDLKGPFWRGNGTWNPYRTKVV